METAISQRFNFSISISNKILRFIRANIILNQSIYLSEAHLCILNIFLYLFFYDFYFWGPISHISIFICLKKIVAKKK